MELEGANESGTSQEGKVPYGSNSSPAEPTTPQPSPAQPQPAPLSTLHASQPAPNFLLLLLFLCRTHAASR
jgi:hypothetical protein